jgi:hypothetical protein
MYSHYRSIQVAFTCSHTRHPNLQSPSSKLRNTSQVYHGFGREDRNTTEDLTFAEKM